MFRNVFFQNFIVISVYMKGYLRFCHRNAIFRLVLSKVHLEYKVSFCVYVSLRCLYIIEFLGVFE